MSQHYIAFPVPDSLLSKSNRFFEAMAANDASAGAIFSDMQDELAEIMVNTLLLHPLGMAKISSVMEKLVRVCASTGMKVTGMLSSKLYKKAPREELERVAAVWQVMLQDFNDGKGWRVGTVLNDDFSARLVGLLDERGTAEVYHPKDISVVVKAYEQLSDVVINDIFLRPTRELKLGRITEGLLSTGVSTVNSTIHSVMHNVIGKLPPVPLTNYIDYTTQFHVVK